MQERTTVNALYLLKTVLDVGDTAVNKVMALLLRNTYSNEYVSYFSKDLYNIFFNVYVTEEFFLEITVLFVSMNLNLVGQ